MLRSSDWLEEARAELKAARDLLATDNYAWCCFTSQQAAEKALKGILDHQRRLPFGHNLNQLVADIAIHSSVPTNVTNAARRLNRHYIPPRYPDAFPSGVPAQQYSRPDAEDAVADAEAVVDFAAGYIGTP